MALAELMARLVAIQNACVDPATLAKQQEEERALDDFARQKRKLQAALKDSRAAIAERDRLMAKSGDTADTVKLSTQIRKQIKGLKEDAQRLEELQKEEEAALEKREKKGKKIDPDDTKRVEKREELVELCYEHVGEVLQLEKGKYRGGDSSDSDSQLGMVDGVYVTELPELEGDEAFLKLKEKDQQIDQKLYVIQDGIAVLKEMAINIGQEVDVQTLMIAELDADVEHANERVVSMNRRLKQTLRDVRKGDRFCMDIICCIILLAIIGFLYNQFSGAFTE